LSRNALVCRATSNHIDHISQNGSDSKLDNSIQDVKENNQLNDLVDVMVLRKGRKIQYRKNSVKKKKKKSSSKVRYSANKGKKSLRSPILTIQNDWSHLELLGVGQRNKN
jgi:hypothetical protein